MRGKVGGIFERRAEGSWGIFLGFWMFSVELVSFMDGDEGLVRQEL